jgi:hypothetical protein
MTRRANCSKVFVKFVCEALVRPVVNLNLVGASTTNTGSTNHHKERLPTLSPHLRSHVHLVENTIRNKISALGAQHLSSQ